MLVCAEGYGGILRRQYCQSNQRLFGFSFDFESAGVGICPCVKRDRYGYKRLTKKEKISLIPFHVADDEIAEDAQYYLGRLHWIDAMTPPMYQRVEELTAMVLKSLGRDNAAGMSSLAASVSAPAYRLIAKVPQARSVFAGRNDLLEEIHRQFLNGERVLFLEGIGGIGKSELAKQYALSHTDLYDRILFVTYVDSLQNLVCDSSQIEIDPLERRDEETDEEFFQRKMQIFRSLTDEHTLLIVDNFDVDGDPDLKLFLEGSHRILFTTRNAHPGYAEISVKGHSRSGSSFLRF